MEYSYSEEFPFLDWYPEEEMEMCREIEWPAEPGRHIILLRTNEWMVDRGYRDPFRQHRMEGPARVQITVYPDGGASTVYGFWDEKEPADAR